LLIETGEYLKAKIRTAVKGLFMKTIDGRASYDEIEKLSLDVISQAETIFSVRKYPWVDLPLGLDPMST